MAGSAVVGSLRIILGMDTADFMSATKQVSSAAKGFSRDFQSLGREATRLGSGLTTALSLPLIGVGLGAGKLAMDFESSFAGIRKTVDATEPEFQAMALSFRNLAKEIPVNVNELNRLGEAAGALGIPKEEIVDFARVMAQLGVTTNVTADQAAESIAKIQTIFGASGQATENFASALVHLGNNGASTEQEILALATRIASAGNTVGLSQAQVLGFSAAIANVGMDAEAGGSAMSRVFLDISSAVSKGGKDLDEFARIAKMNASDFAKLFGDDASAATQAFITGLGNIQKSGGDLNTTLTELGFTELRQADLLRRLAGDTGNLSTALNDSNESWAQSSALSEEARKRFETTSSQLTLLWTRIQDVGITLGNAMAPAISVVIGLADKLIPALEFIGNAFAAMPEPVQAILVGFAGLVAAIGPLLLVAGQLAFAASSVTAAFAAGGVATTALAAVMPVLSAAFALLTGPIGLILAAIVGLGLAWYKWGDDVTAVVSAAYTAVKEWLWDKLEPVLTPLIGLLESIGKMFEAFGMLVGAVAEKVYGAVSSWLGEKIVAVFNGLMAVVQVVVDTIGTVLGKIPDALLPLLGPIGAVVLAFRKWDEITRIATAVYTGVKTWLLDKFTEIVNGVKAKVDAVTGFFKDMYDKVVGGSYVPDMIEGIKTEFGKLEGSMVAPVQDAVTKVNSHFEGMLSDVTSRIESFGSSLEGMITSHIGGPLGKGMAGIAGQLIGSVSTILTGGLSSLFAMAMPFVLEGMKKLGEAVWNGIKSIGSAIGGLFKGEGARTNDTRDEWMDRLGGFEAAHLLIGSSGNDPALMAAFERAYFAGTREQFQEGASAFDARRAELGLAEGGIAVSPTWRMFGEAGPEAVLPLDRLGSMLQGAEMQGLGWSNRQQTVIFEMDGRQFARAIIPPFAEEVKRLQLTR